MTVDASKEKALKALKDFKEVYKSCNTNLRFYSQQQQVDNALKAVELYSVNQIGIIELSRIMGVISMPTRQYMRNPTEFKLMYDALKKAKAAGLGFVMQSQKASLAPNLPA